MAKGKQPDGLGYFFIETRTTKKGQVLYYCWRIKVGGRDAKPTVVRRRTDAERKTAVTKKLQELEQRGFLQPAGEVLTVAQRMNFWLETRIKPPRREEKTYNSYESNVRNHILPSIGKVKTNRLTSNHVRILINHCIDAKLGERTTEYVVQIFFMGLKRQDSVLLKAAVVDDGEVEIPKSDITRDRVLEPEEIIDVLAKLYESVDIKSRPGESRWRFRDRHLIKFLLNSGPRKSEALAIQSLDINARTGDVTLSKQLHRTKDKRGAGKWILKPHTKTDDVRVIPLNPDAAEALSEQIAMVDSEKAKLGRAYDDWGLVFPSETGAPLDPRNLTRTLDRVQEEINAARTEAKLPEREHFTIHDLRRSFGSYLAEIEPRMQIVAAVLGHKRIETTKKFYVRADRNVVRASVSNLRLQGNPPPDGKAVEN